MRKTLQPGAMRYRVPLIWSEFAVRDETDQLFQRLP
jgi:hypothetical protein